MCIVVWAGCYLFIMLSHQVPLLRINRQHQNINCNTLRSDIVKCPKIIIRHHYHDQASLSFSSFAFSYYRQQTVAALFTLSSALLLFFFLYCCFIFSLLLLSLLYSYCHNALVWFGLVSFIIEIVQAQNFLFMDCFSFYLVAFVAVAAVY